MEHTYSVGPRSDTERPADAMSIGWQWKRELATGLFGNSFLRSVWGVADIARVMGSPNGPKSVSDSSPRCHGEEKLHTVCHAWNRRHDTTGICVEMVVRGYFPWAVVGRQE